MGYIAIIRPINCLITFFCVLVGAWISRSPSLPLLLLIAAIAACAVCAFGNIVNDIYDIEIDRLNNPNRPLVKNTVQKSIVIVIALFLMALAVGFGLILGFMPFIIIIGTLILLFLYAYHFKRTIIANPLVALISGLSFILGGIIMKNNACLVPFIFSFFIHMPREIIKDILDLKGDQAFGVISLPIYFGEERARVISSLLLGLLCIILPLPYFVNILSIRYIIIVILGAYPIILYTIFKLLSKPKDQQLQKISMLLKVSMAVGVVAMVI